MVRFDPITAGRFILIFSASLAFHAECDAQARLTLQQGSSTVSSRSFSEVKDPNFRPNPICPPPEINSVNPGTQLRRNGPADWFWGGATSYIQRGIVDSSCFISAQGTANVQVRHNDSSTIYVQWWCHSNTQYDCYAPDCAWYANDTSSLNAHISIAITGVSPGTPVTVSYRWDQFSSVASRSEAASEDGAAVENTALNLFNRAGFNGTMDHQTANQKFAQNRTGSNTRTFSAMGGDTLTIDVSAKTLAYIYPPPVSPNNQREDDASADFFGYVFISVSTGTPVPHDSCSLPTLHYSVDIGSDAEFSDPTPEGSEQLDPGDLYSSSAITATPSFNDSLLFLADPYPAVGHPAGTCTPGPLQQWQHVLNFDLDGTDRIDFDLAANPGAYGPGVVSIPAYPSDCVFLPTYLLVSYDEDRGIHFSSAVNCNVPSSFAAQDSILVKGINANHDEVYCANLVYDSAGLYIGYAMPFRSEDEFSVLLSPSPASGYPADKNDDVDALDLEGGTSCNSFYFSVDHEAHYIRKGDTLRPGYIYQYISPDSFLAVILPPAHLGLSDNTDIDAFEFAWVWDPAQGRYALGLVFSVSVNDPFSAIDYTGGLNPGTLYASYLDGFHFELLKPLRPGNVDAITFGCQPFIPSGSVYINPNLSIGPSPARGQASDLQVYPNPNDGVFTIAFALGSPAAVRSSIVDMVGRTQWSSGSSKLQPGMHRMNVAGPALAAGSYFLELRVAGNGGEQVLRRMFQILE